MCCSYIICYLTGNGVDYVSGPFNITLFTNQTTASFKIYITNELVEERNEAFLLTITNSTLPHGIHLGTPYSATVFIFDDECK